MAKNLKKLDIKLTDGPSHDAGEECRTPRGQIGYFYFSVVMTYINFARKKSLCFFWSTISITETSIDIYIDIYIYICYYSSKNSK